MKKKDKTEHDDEIRGEYDLAQLDEPVKGKYAKRYKKGTNLALLTAEVAEAFPSNEAVNDALRMLMRIAKASIKHQH